MFPIVPIGKRLTLILEKGDEERLLNFDPTIISFHTLKFVKKGGKKYFQLMFAFRGKEKKNKLKWGFLQLTRGWVNSIQSNEIEHVFHLFLRDKQVISLQNCA